MQKKKRVVRKRRKSPRDRIKKINRLLVVCSVLLFFLIVLLVYVFNIEESVVVAASPAPSSYPTLYPEESLPPSVSPVVSPSATLPPAVKKVYIYLILDDAGYSLEEVRPFVELPFPLTVSVLPHLPYSREVSELVYSSGKRVFLHLPMESDNGNDPGPGAILSDMDAMEIAKRTEEAIRSIPHIVGVNNHMGSRITRDPFLMQQVLSILLQHNLYFVDSRTTADSVAYDIARNMGIAVLKRDVFLDNKDDRGYILQALERAASIAEERGMAVAIGHVWSDNLASVLSEVYEPFKKRGVFFADIVEGLRK